MDTAWIALVGTLLGGAGFKIIESLLNKAEQKSTTATELRDELRQDISRLKDDLRGEEKSADDWRGRYYKVLENNLTNAVTIDKLKGRLSELEEKIKQF